MFQTNLWPHWKQSSKADNHESEPNVDIEDIERSDSAQNEGMAQVGRVEKSQRHKEMLLRGTDGRQKSQQCSNELLNAQKHQQLAKRELADLKKQKIELKKQNTELTEDLQMRSKDLPKLQEKYNSLRREYQSGQNDADELALARKTIGDSKETIRKTEASFCIDQKEMTALKAKLRSRTVDLKRAIGLKKATEHESERLCSQLETTREQLQLCKDDLFRLQPMAQVPDTEIIKDLESIGQDVIAWIDVEISAFERSNPSAKSSQIFSGAADSEAIHLLEHLPTFGEYLVRYVVHYLLHRHIFSRYVYLLGLPMEMKQYLQAAEQRMASLEPPRDFETINAWRSETLTAIAATPEFRAKREAQINAVAEEIFHVTSQHFPIIRLHAQSKQRLLDEVVLPAAKLATKSQVAMSTYVFDLPPHPLWEYKTVTNDDHKLMKMVDVQTRKIVKGSSIQDGARRIGYILLPLEPSLWRIDKNAGSTLLRPEVNLVNNYHP